MTVGLTRTEGGRRIPSTIGLSRVSFDRSPLSSPAFWAF
jgi:hypothetical protein